MSIIYIIMKTHNSGRQDFLLWINEFTECDYPKIEVSK